MAAPVASGSVAAPTDSFVGPVPPEWWIPLLDTVSGGGASLSPATSPANVVSSPSAAVATHFPSMTLPEASLPGESTASEADSALTSSRSSPTSADAGTRTVTASEAPRAKISAVKILSIVAPVVVLSIVVAAVFGWWIQKRRREKKRADHLAERARWYDQSYVDQIKAKMHGLDDCTAGLNCAKQDTSPGGDSLFVRKVRPAHGAIGTAVTTGKPPIPRRSSNRISAVTTSLPQTPPARVNNSYSAPNTPSLRAATPHSTRSAKLSSETEAGQDGDGSPGSSVIVTRNNLSHRERLLAINRSLALLNGEDPDAVDGSTAHPHPLSSHPVEGAAQDLDLERNAGIGRRISRRLSKVVRRRGGLDQLRRVSRTED